MSDHDTIEKIVAEMREFPSHRHGSSSINRVLDEWAERLVENDATNELMQVYEAFGIGEKARTLQILMTNIENTKRFAEYLHAIEREFFMVPGEVDEDFPDDEPEPECLLNSWGSTKEQYIEQFRSALDRLDSLRQVPEGYVLVPRKITEAMCDACHDVPTGIAGSPPHPQWIWDAMLAAAPKANPAPPTSGGKTDDRLTREQQGALDRLKPEPTPAQAGAELPELSAVERQALQGILSNVEHDAGDTDDLAPSIVDDEDAYWAWHAYNGLSKLLGGLAQPGAVLVPRDVLLTEARRLRYRAGETLPMVGESPATDAGSQMIHTAETLERYAND